MNYSTLNYLCYCSPTKGCTAVDFHLGAYFYSCTGVLLIHCCAIVQGVSVEKVDISLSSKKIHQCKILRAPQMRQLYVNETELQIRALAVSAFRQCQPWVLLFSFPVAQFSVGHLLDKAHSALTRNIQLVPKSSISN